MSKTKHKTPGVKMLFYYIFPCLIRNPSGFAPLNDTSLFCKDKPSNFMPHFTNSICPNRGDQIQTHHTFTQLSIQISFDQLRNKNYFSITHFIIYNISPKLPISCRVKSLCFSSEVHCQVPGVK